MPNSPCKRPHDLPSPLSLCASRPFSQGIRVNFVCVVFVCVAFVYGHLLASWRYKLTSLCLVLHVLFLAACLCVFFSPVTSASTR